MPLRYLKNHTAVLLMLLPAAAQAACTRPIIVPAAPTGYSVVVDGERVSGAIPDTLRELAAKSGCTFEFPVMPRARIASMFLDSGEADVLVPASRSAERDRVAVFVPMMKWKVELISLRQRRVAAASVAALLAQKDLRAVVVRSYVFGDEYNQLLRSLEAEHRVYYANDLVSAARMLQSGRADFTINAPALFLGALADDATAAPLAAELASQPLVGMPMTESGAYLSRRSLLPADQRTLRALLQEAGKGVLWRQFQKYYPPDLLKYAEVPH